MSGVPIAAVECIEGAGPRRPGDDRVFVVVRTSGGDGWYGPVAAPVAAKVSRVLAPRTVGLDAVDGETTRAVQLRAAPGQVDAVTSWALGAIDCALWDLRGHLAQLPVADLLSSRAARSVPAYASWLTCDLADRRHAQRVARVGRGEWAFTKWSLRARPNSDVSGEAARLARSIERRTTAGVKVAVDAQGSWGVALTEALLDLVGPNTALCIEDPLDGHDLRAYRQLARAGLRVALGEHLRLGENVRALIDAAQPVALGLDVVGCGGLSSAVEVAKIAQSHGVPVYPHGRSLIPGIHLAAAFPSAVHAVEYRLQWEPRRQRQLECQHLPRRGHLDVPRQPGLSTRPRRLR